MQKLRHNSHLENLVPLFGQLRSSSHCFVPHNWKIHNTTKVLSDSYCTVQIQDHVPPPPGHKHSLSRSLKNLQLSFIEKNSWSGHLIVSYFYMLIQYSFNDFLRKFSVTERVSIFHEALLFLKFFPFLTSLWRDIFIRNFYILILIHVLLGRTPLARMGPWLVGTHTWTRTRPHLSASLPPRAGVSPVL